ncbi:MAG: VOC family protein [Ignavibacteria bacterium]
MSPSLLASIGVQYVDHVAVTTPDLAQTLADFLSLPDARLLRGPAVNQRQKVAYAFVQIAPGNVVEILAPEPDSPIRRHVEGGGGAYHFCYAVADIERAVASAAAAGARCIVEPMPDVAFDERRVAFFMHRAHGLLEVVEALPQHLAAAPIQRSPAQFRAPAPERSGGDREARLRALLRRLFPSTAGKEAGAAMNSTREWDSARHLKLIMELEDEFEIRVSAESVGMLTDYSRLLDYLVRDAGERK